MMGKFYTWFDGKFSAWLAKRQPVQQQTVLTQKVIYILPSRFGWWFIFLIILLYLMGTNYQNNLILLLSFILLSVLLVAMNQAFFNLHKLQLAVSTDASSFAPVAPCMDLVLNTKQAHMLQLGLKGHKQQQLIPLVSNNTPISLTLPELSRGYYPLPRLQLSSLYPLGLFRCWSYPALAAGIWVYPNPQQQNQTDTRRFADSTGQASQHQPSPEPHELRDYQPGDSPKRIVWRKLASSPEQPVVRATAQSQAPLPNWVKVPPLQGLALEHTLSHACQQLLTLEQQGVLYGLQTPSTTIAPASGSRHLQRCLQELALC